MDLNELVVFARVAQAGSFTAAARELAMPKSTVSRRIADLEARLGARLLQRTTRKLALTDAGLAYFEHAERAIGAAQEAELAVTRLQGTPRGLLRVTSPLSFQYLGPIVAEFLQRYPEVQLELVCTDRVVHLVEEGFDCAIRAGNLADSSLIARPVAALKSFLVASEAYLARRGTPSDVDALAQHDCLAFGAGVDRTTWRLESTDRRQVVALRPRLLVNDFDMLHDATVAGLGIALLPAYRCAEDVASSRLRRVLDGWSAAEVPIHVLYPSSRHLSPKVKAFVDHLRDRHAAAPWEQLPIGRRLA